MSSSIISSIRLDYLTFLITVLFKMGIQRSFASSYDCLMCEIIGVDCVHLSHRVNIDVTNLDDTYVIRDEMSVQILTSVDDGRSFVEMQRETIFVS